MRIKKLIAAAAAAALTLSAVPVLAYEFPNSFWPLNDGFNAAVSAGDYYGIIDYGTRSVEMMEGEPQNSDTLGVLASRTYEVANAYEMLGDYENAAVYFEKYIPYGEYFGWDDGVNIARAKTDAFPSSLDLYTLSSEPTVYFWAKNEPKSGVYYGQVNEETESSDSMTLIYQEYGDTSTLNWLDAALSEAEASGRRVELALNFPGEGSQLDSIISDTSFIDSLCSVLREHSSLVMYLRIGAEMNVWSDLPDAGKYISAFRKVAAEARNASSNIATVWSVGHTSPNGVEMNDFYPGDEYVDWVGVSAYAVRYFMGRSWSAAESYNEIYFKAGDGADPVRILREVVTKYGDRKPIMIAEGGAARYTRGEVFADSTEWARLNILRMYSVAMMEYPQIKLAAYFNKATPGEAQDYDIESVPELEAAFESVTSMPWFIQRGETAAQSFARADGTVYAGGSTLEIYAAPYVFRDSQPRVDYYVDGAWVGAAVYLPYGTTLDLSAVSDGTHVLEAVVTSNGAEKLRRSYSLQKSAPAAPGAGGFSDTGALSKTQGEAVEFVSSGGIVNGYEDGSFRPGASITRAEFAAMVCRAFGYDSSGRCSFTDAADHWASGYIKACADRGAINGTGNGLFSPEDNVTFEQAAKILTVCAGLTDGVGVAYPQGFVSIGDDAGMFRYMENRTVGSSLARIDAACMFYGCME
ncbi:MAG TPA: S-layer homology domain-containing protein [Candidatus Monoglobus merdigallinarum]|uniref:S-layer homology domain-containing protein n=1 Tax=Candidatus Monoglobus merdigallinarum TaxID=2838698 RepID=A0A9D1TLS5_9FIRM|nr:S-layer homology domain-containing protein [Candidatus Monoglobus merdigallinarum]